MTDKFKPTRGAGHIVAPKRKRNRWNERRRQIFLAELADTGSVRSAAAKAKMSYASAYLLKHRDPAFERSWREALEIGFSELELSLLRQAIEGTERIETMTTFEDGQEGRIKYEKRVRSHPLTVAMRLYNSHREEVMAFRAERALEQDEAEVEARVKAQMDEVRGRLIAQGIIGDEAGDGE